jgi:adenylosuccinate lyase
MDLNTLTAISPIDGRYRRQVAALAPYLSEFALIRYRVRVEVDYFIALCQLPLPQLADFPAHLFPALRKVYRDFGLEDAELIKNIERTTNHDVKAVEYFLKRKLATLGMDRYAEFVHFGLTSQDVNNTATPLMLKEAMQEVYYPLLGNLLNKLTALAQAWASVPMLAYTHGQPASPTRVGKELDVFAYRLGKQWETLRAIPFTAKFGGATGNLNAHVVAYPGFDWVGFANQFVGQMLGLERAQKTTQIENYDFLAATLDNLRRINTILIDFARDVWSYISMGYFKQKINPDEVGSSAMPHKVNPIDFENAEGNLGYANAIFGFLAEKLPISRLQRDLTDSTVLRNLGVPLGHTLIALQSLAKGLDKLELNRPQIERDLAANWAVVAEALQSILRREGYPQPYEALKALTRTGGEITPELIGNFIDTLPISEVVKAEMKQVTPFNYTGV